MQDSWIEVIDTNGDFLFYSLGKAGQVKEIQGKPPLRVKIGNPYGVRMYYQEEMIDMQANVNDRGVLNIVLQP